MQGPNFHKEIGAGDRAQTGGLRLGKATLYQLSYTRTTFKVLAKNHKPATHVNYFMLQYFHGNAY